MGPSSHYSLNQCSLKHIQISENEFQLLFDAQEFALSELA
jgi:hypothetical protein